jgi:hypothetical protein
MGKRLLAAVLSAGLLVGPLATAQSTQPHSTNVRSDPHRRRRGSASRSIGMGALGGAAVGGLVGGRRGVLLGGGMGAGVGAFRHRRRRVR